MSNRWYGRAVSVCSIALGCAFAAQANTSTYQIAGEATATITTSMDTISISLTDLFVNPTAVSENLSALSFTTSVIPTSDSINLVTSLSDSRIIASDGTYASNGTITEGWVLTLTSATTRLDDLVGAGHAGPANTLVGSPDGSNVYSAGKGSLDGAPSHNPFLDKTAAWTLTEDGVTSATNILSVVFQFGTTTNSGVGGTLVATPEPASAGLFAFGGIALLLMGRKSLLRSR